MPIFVFYLLKVILCSALLFGYYHLFLRNKVYHAYNRFYLLVSVIIAMLAPIINFKYFFIGTAVPAKPIQLLQVVTSGDEYLEEVIIYSHRNFFSLSQILTFIYIFVSLVLLGGLIKVLIQIVQILKTNSSKYIHEIVFVESNAKGTPFSFFKFIFWNNAIDIKSETGQQIFAHELAHVREKHSIDKLFLNIVLILCWINPIFWLIKKELNLIHEFIADKKAVANNDASALAAMIVTSAYPKHAYLLTNHFFYSPIKRRLQMLSKYNTKKAGYFYRILALPVMLFLVAAFTIKTKAGIEKMINPAKIITVVIDAGHGGSDGGATGLDGSSEKDINLAFVKRIQELNQVPNIKLVLTRETDIYQTPQEKAAIAKKAGADLFISIHSSSGPFAKATNSGMEVFVSRDELSNSKASKLFASSVIAHFKTNYGINVAPAPLQRKAGIYVLQANECPSIIIETGYLSNKTDLAYLRSSKAKDDFAKNLLEAIAQYADNINNNSTEEIAAYKIDTTVLPKNNLGIYKGQNIKRLNVVEKETYVELIMSNGEVVKMTMSEAAKLHLPIPPPPPPPPAPPVAALEEFRKTDASEHSVMNGQKVTHISTNTISSDKQPIYIVDGKEILSVIINDIDPNCISSINVLKGETAIKKYGSLKAENGIIEINTKSGVVYKKSKNDKNEALEINVSNITFNGNTTEEFANDKVFNKLEQEAEFPGGSKAWLAYLRQNLNANTPVDEGWKAGTFKVVVSFIVNKDGSLREVVAENYAGSKTAQACIDLIKNGPLWIPGKQNGYTVTSYKKQPITFVIEE
jgi:N-acetylmuramoyl-L-alanine amidase